MKIRENIELGQGLILEKGLPEGFVITDSNLFEKYGFLIKGRYFVIEVGEKSKSLENYSEVIKKLENEERIVALGGGVVGDLAGFVASTYKRGIDLIQVPTSLMAMVDSSIGGKNGVNVGEKKNYLGTIYQPKKILIDTQFLKTLPEEEFRSGVAEIIKYGIIFGKLSLARLGRGVFVRDYDLKEIISECVRIKLSVVSRDERDLGYRHVLNFGHTVGHALELIYGLKHGEAIAIGMVAEMKIGKNFFSDEMVGEVEKVIEANGLSVNLPKNLDVERILQLMKQDKKGSFVFAFGEKNYNVSLAEKEVKEFLKNE